MKRTYQVLAAIAAVTATPTLAGNGLSDAGREPISPTSVSALTKVYGTYAASDDVQRPLPHGPKTTLSTSNIACKSKNTCTLLLSATESVGDCYFSGWLWGMLILLDGKKVVGRAVGLTVRTGQQITGTLQGVVANVAPGSHQVVLQSTSQTDCTEYYYSATWSVGRP